MPVILLDSISPYGSRRVSVEYDGSTTAAYLRDGDTVISATWIANHVAAPSTVNESWLSHGRAPLMPSGRTLVGSRPPLVSDTLEAVWFEEGDGVAVLEHGRPLAVLPGWSHMARGLPGYSRDVVGQTPFGWSLADALDGLAPRIDRAAAYWRWRLSPDGWGQYQQAVLGHLLGRLGPGGQYWEVSGGRQPLVGVSERPGSYPVLSTVGMSCQRMPVVEQVLDNPSAYARVELAVAVGTSARPAEVARVFAWLALYPWQAVTWFGPGHTVRWPASDGAFPLSGGAGFEGVVLLDDFALRSMPGPEPPDLSGFEFGGDAVRWLWVVPITEPDRRLAKDRGSAALVSRLTASRRGWVVALVHVQVDAEQDEPPEQDGEQRARDDLEDRHRDIAAVPGDEHADDEVHENQQVSQAAHGSLPGDVANRRAVNCPGCADLCVRQERLEQEPGDRRGEQQRVDPVQHAAVPGQQPAEVLDAQVTLDDGGNQVAADRGDHGGRAE